MKKIAANLICMAIMAVGVVMPATGAAQDVRNRIIPNVTFENSDIRDALKVLFRSVGVSYSVASDVQGLVTANLKDVAFEAALRNLLNQVDATYRIEANIYNIIRKPTENPAGITGLDQNTVAQRSEPIQKIRIRVADPALIIAILGGTTNPYNSYPELSTLQGVNSFGGGGGRGFGGSGGGFGGSGGGFGGSGGGFGGSGGGFGGSGGGFGGGGGGFGGGGGGGGFGR